MKFSPQQYVRILALDCKGRINRCIIDGGLQPIYQVTYAINGDIKFTEFLEDELELEGQYNEQ